MTTNTTTSTPAWLLAVACCAASASFFRLGRDGRGMAWFGLALAVAFGVQGTVRMLHSSGKTDESKEKRP